MMGNREIKRGRKMNEEREGDERERRKYRGKEK